MDMGKVNNSKARQPILKTNPMQSLAIIKPKAGI